MGLDIRRLALDTLFGGKEEDSKSCFVVNKAGQDLRRCGAEAISAMEEIMCSHVVPAMIDYREQHGVPDPDALFREGPPFSGLSSFLGAYWVICARTNAARAVHFMSEMPQPVVYESVSQLPVFFNIQRPLADVAIPGEYVDYLKALRESEVQEFKNIARWACGRLGIKESTKN